MPLLNNEKHERMHSIGPKDLTWGESKVGLLGKLLGLLLKIFGLSQFERPVSTFSVTRSTIDNEQVTVSVPIFASDTRDTMMDRIGMIYSIPQDRQDDANKAWEIVDQERKKKIEEEAELKKNAKRG
jgi:hypothetical protein